MSLHLIGCGSQGSKRRSSSSRAEWQMSHTNGAMTGS
jgi:hypothetical protein